MKRYFLNFIEECILNPDYYGCVGGRIEVEDGKNPWPIEEIRFLTRRRDRFEQFRDRWDGAEVSGRRLEKITAKVRGKFRDGAK